MFMNIIVAPEAPSYRGRPSLMAILLIGFAIMYLLSPTEFKSLIPEVSVRIQLNGETGKPVVEL